MPSVVECGMAKSWKTKLIHPEAHAPEGFKSLADPVYRGSTVVFPDAAAIRESWNPYKDGYTYGVYGTPTTLELAVRICELEHGIGRTSLLAVRRQFRWRIFRF